MKPARILKSVGRGLLQFLNLKEPREDGKTLLSLSKLAVWVSLLIAAVCGWAVWYMVTHHPEFAGETIAALAALVGGLNLGAFGNYAWRRHIQHKEGGVK